ncbi:MAG: hypothetical protein ACN6PN_03745 [Sphingobacterium sp.]
MKNKLFTLAMFLLFSSLTLKGQQHPLSIITNSYIKPGNQITDVDSLNDLRNLLYSLQYGGNDPLQYEELPDFNSYYCIFDKVETSKKIGALEIQCSKSDHRNINFTSAFDSYFQAIKGDEPIESYIVGTIRNNDINAGYFYYKPQNSLNIVIYGKSKPGFVRAAIDVFLPNQGTAVDNFAQDFINQTKFK